MPLENVLNTNQTPVRGELTAAVKRGDAKAVKDLLGRGADVEDADARGNTALMSAVVKSPALVRLLVERGADPYRENEDGYHARDLFEENRDENWQWPAPFSTIEIGRILREAPERRRLFLEKKAADDSAAEAVKALAEKRDRLRARAPKLVIPAGPRA